jgi:hypothetical protein
MNMQDVKNGAWRSWPCEDCGECLDRGPVWDREADGWRCLTCGHFERHEKPMAQWVSVFLGGCALLFIFLTLLRTLGMFP